MNLGAFWRGRRVLLTGHTGFKGGWLGLWLNSLGAEVHGYALAPPTEPALFDVAGLAGAFATSTIADIRDRERLMECFREVAPDVVFHLAAQPLVRLSYREPVDTFATNVMGVVNLFEAVRVTPTVRAVVNVTTDKCYENREWPWAYREIEAMGGHDPYSASKGCAELVTAAYRRSFLQQAGVGVASARAGNVIGGGDWASDRLLPDIFRAADAGRELSLRSPAATRPWQHVLEPLSGYLILAQALCERGGVFADAWNFGPADDDSRSVGWIVKYLAQSMPALRWSVDAAVQPHEAHHLKLDSSKARGVLGWAPHWRLDQALDRTAAWHQAWKRGDDMRVFSLAQIVDYMSEREGGQA